MNEQEVIRGRALDLINVYVQKIEEARNILTKEDTNYKLVKLRLKGAFLLAKKNEHLLSEAQRELVNSRLGLNEVPEVVPENDQDWLPQRAPDLMLMPPKDARAVQFCSQLSIEDQVKFEELRRLVFYLAFTRFIESMQKVNRRNENKFDHPMPQFRERLLFKDYREVEALIASRIAMIFFSNEDEVFSYDVLTECRYLAVNKLEKEQLKDLGVRKEQKIKFEEFKRRIGIKKWVEKQRSLHKLSSPPPPASASPKAKKTLKSIISTNKKLSLGCKPLLNEFYEDLKAKHLRLVNCKKFMEKIVANHNTPNKTDKILIIQLRKMLKNDG